MEINLRQRKKTEKGRMREKCDGRRIDISCRWSQGFYNDVHTLFVMTIVRSKRLLARAMARILH